MKICFGFLWALLGFLAGPGLNIGLTDFVVLAAFGVLCAMPCGAYGAPAAAN